MRNAMRKFMLGTALVAGLFATGAASAKAEVREFRPDRGFYHGPVPARGYDHAIVRDYYRPAFGVAVGGPVVAGAYIPPCPGDGYVWLNGAWVFRGRPEVVRGYGYGRPAHFDRFRR
jgi:hypothetical protein